MTAQNDYEVVISGVGGYFPNCRNIEEFQEGLLKNENLMSNRWKAGEMGTTNVLGTVPPIERFDASYFGIHSSQSHLMDPMQRLLLERSYEAIIDAGINPVNIKGRNIAVFGGATVGENDNLFYELIASGFGVTGHSRAMMPNRISYWLNLKGPSCAYENNWLNGVEVLQSAYEVVRTGQCEAAIVGTSNLALNSELSWLYNDMGLLSPDGATRSFDANANGYGRSDGAIALFIQRACDAKRKYATIVGVDSLYCGVQRGPFRDVHVNHMSDFIQNFYDKRKIDPKDVEFVECYGCGNKKVDEAELEAVDRVYCKNRDKPLLVGAVKPNTGHSEASSIFTSLVKVLVAMETGIIPATLNYETPNPNIESVVKGRIEVVAKNKEWGSRLAAVNGIGLGSSYGHVLLRANPKPKQIKCDDLPRLVNISTRNEEGIQKIIKTLKTTEKVDPEYACMINDIFKKTIPGHLYRGYAVLDGTEEAKTEFEYYPGNKRPVWFVYSGMGSQWCKMASDLMVLPIFAEAIHNCHKVLEPKGIDLLTIVTADDEKMFENILHSFVGIAAVQIGLTDIIRAVGIVPDGIIGHSVGELGCAYADGCLTAEQMILCAYSRGRASLEANLIRGMMAAIGMGYQQIKDKCPPAIEVACHNGSDSCTISGPTEDMEVFVKELQEKGVFAKLVNVSNIAYHSRYIKPAAPLLLQYLQEVIPEPLPRSSRWISTSVSEDQWDSDLSKTSSAEYHTNNLLSSVLFEEGSKHIPKDAIVIEIAPHGLLQAILKRSLKANTTNIPLTHRTSKNGLIFLLQALGKLYLAGLDQDVSALYPKIEYPVSRGTRSLTPLISWEHGEFWRSGLLDKLNQQACIRDLKIALNNKEYKELIGHQLYNSFVIPISTYLSFVYDIFNNFAEKKITEFMFEDMTFKNIVRVPKLGSASVYVMVYKGSGYFEISSGNELIVIGRIRISDENQFKSVPSIEESKNDLKLTADDVYNEFYHRSHNYQDAFKHIKTLYPTENGSLSKTKWNSSWQALIEAMLQQHFFYKGERTQNVLTVAAIQKIVISLIKLPEEPTDIDVTYDYSTGIISTPGIQVSGIDVRSLGLDSPAIAFSANELKSLSNTKFQKIEGGINFGLQLAMNNLEDKVVRSIMIVEIQTDNPSLENNIKNVINKNLHITASFTSVQNSKDVLISQTQPVYVIMNNTPNKDWINLVASSNIFLLARTDSIVSSNPIIGQIAEFTVDGISYCIIRRRIKLSPTVIPIETDTLTAKDFSREDLPWVTQFKSAVASGKGQKFYLTFSVVPLEGVTNFFKDVGCLPGIQNVRFVFVLDKSPKSIIDEPAYKVIFDNDFALSIIKNGIVATYIAVPTEFEDTTGCKLLASSNIIGNARIDYLGINQADETIIANEDHKLELGNIDYSGVNSSGDKIIGLARFDSEFCKLVPDPILHWTFRKYWSLEDGATVPSAYVFAYYALVILARTKPSETVLIHGGCSAIGLAAISVAAKIGCSLYTTVTSNKQKVFLKRHFTFMNDHNVFDASNTSFEPHILFRTDGEGVHVIINCLSGNMLQATYRIVANFGKIIQLGKLDVEENIKVGMRMFMKNVSLCTVTLEDISKAPIEIKQQIHDFITDGLKTYSIRPLIRKVVNHQDIKSILSILRHPEHIGKVVIKLSDNLAVNQLNIDRTSLFSCDSTKSYLIYGGVPETWIDVVEWLLFRGARKIVICSELLPQGACIKRRLELYKSYYNLQIIFTSTCPDNKSKASELLLKAYDLGPLGAVLILPYEDYNSNNNSKYSEIGPINYLNSEIKTVAPQALLINFLRDIAGICQVRTDEGFPTYNVQWENSLEFSDVLYNLDNLLQLKARDILIKNEQIKENVDESAQSLFKKLSLLLPNSIEILKGESAVALSKPDFSLLSSLCEQKAREVPPIFIIPRMFNNSAIEGLSSKLLYPVYCANFTKHYMSLKTIAALLAKKMIDICPRGPYNIIGVSYGGVLAIEIAKILEQENHKTSLQLLDGAPDTAQGALKHLGEGPEREIGFLYRILNLTNPEIVEDMNNLPNWDARLKFALKYYECPAAEKLFLMEVLTTLKKHLDEVSSFEPFKHLVSGQISLLRPGECNKFDVCGLQRYCKQNADISLINGNHTTILKQKATAAYINNKVMC